MGKFFRDYVAPALFLVGGGFLASFELERFYGPLYQGFVATCFVLLLVILGYSARLELKRRRANHEPIFRWKDPFEVFFSVVGCLVIALALTGYLLAITHVILYAYALLSNSAVDRGRASALVALLVAITGCGLFWFRLVARACYGAIEVLVGLYVALAQVQNIAPGRPVLQENVLLALLTAGVYLVVRGLDNVHQGWTSPKPDRVAHLIIRLITRRPSK